MNRVFYVALGIVLGGIGCVFHTGPSRNEVMTSRRKDVKRCVPAQNENVKIWDNLSKYSFDYNGLKAEVQKLKGLEMVFVDVPVVGLSEVAQDGSIVVKLGYPGKEWKDGNPYMYTWMRVRFGKEAVDLVDIDMWDRLTSVRVRFTGTVEEWGGTVSVSIMRFRRQRTRWQEKTPRRLLVTNSPRWFANTGLDNGSMRSCSRNSPDVVGNKDKP